MQRPLSWNSFIGALVSAYLELEVGLALPEYEDVPCYPTLPQSQRRLEALAGSLVDPSGGKNGLSS